MFRFFFVVLFALLLKTEVYSSEVLVILYDPYPPYEYEENGEAKGVGIEVVKAALKKANLKAEFKLYPFARAYKMVTEGERQVFYLSLARTPERERLVQWVGVVAPSTQALLSLNKRKIQISSYEDLKKYTIGVVTEDIVDQHLRSFEKSHSLKLERVPTYKQNANKFLMERIDLWGGNELVAHYYANQMSHEKNLFNVAWEFKELRTDYYLVANRAVRREVFDALQLGFQKIHADGTYKKIIQRLKKSHF